MPRKKWRPREGRQRAAERDPEPGLLEPKLAAEPRVCSVTVTYHTPGTWGGGASTGRGLLAISPLSHEKTEVEQAKESLR